MTQLANKTLAVIASVWAVLIVATPGHAATTLADASYVQQQNGPQQNVCGDPSCTLTFAVVPKGYRLEVDYVSAEFVIQTGPPYVLLDNGATGSNHATLTLPTPNILNTVDGVFQNCLLSGATTFFVEAGNKPKVILASSNNMAIGGVGPFRVTVVGKLIPIAAGAVDIQ